MFSRATGGYRTLEVPNQRISSTMAPMIFDLWSYQFFFEFVREPPSRRQFKRPLILQSDISHFCSTPFEQGE